MARKPRIHIDGGYYHVMLRGNGGDDIFLNDDDRYHFYLLIQEGVERFEHRIHAFCLMNNHVHLVIQVGAISLSQIMQNLSFRYTRWLNNRQKRVGHLFQGRFKALLIDEESYLLELVRYTHMNPVRAGMVSNPSDYLWSSHLTYIGDETLPWLTTDVVLSRFSSQLDLARNRYVDFVFDGLSEKHRTEFHVGSSDARVLGDDYFAEKVLASIGMKEKKMLSLAHCTAVVCQVYKLQPFSLSERSRTRKPSEARGVIAWLMRAYGQVTLTEIAAYFNRDVATMSIAVIKIEKRVVHDSNLQARIDEIKCNIKL